MNPLAKLFAAFNKTPSEASGAAYGEALADIPADALELAVGHLVRSARFLPSPAEVLAEARKHVPDPPPLPDRSTPLETPMIVPLPSGGRVAITRTWYYDCNVCTDSGWQDHWCPGGLNQLSTRPWWDEQACGRTHSENDPGHNWVSRCPCAATNPTIQRRAHPRTAA